MKKLLFISLALFLSILLAACVTRIAPLSPHRTNTEAHRKAQTNQDCVDCHSVVEIKNEHKATDNCLRCHRIVQGD
jgi:hypothetical protein